MMKIAIFGATSQIGKDLIKSFSQYTNYDCTLFARKPDAVTDWIKNVNILAPYLVLDYSSFDSDSNYDVIINFVGVGNPAQAKEMGSQIFDITYKYDMMILEYLKENLDTRYLFLSSGAVYGGNFKGPVTSKSVATIPINHLGAMNWYAIAKLYAEARHRAHSYLSIIDIRVFNYFSHTQDLSSRFLITDIVRNIMENKTLKITNANIFRDFLHPSDFFQLIEKLLHSEPINLAIDCYSKAPIDKNGLLKSMLEEFGLQYTYTTNDNNHIGATGEKKYYYSLNRQAEKFGYYPIQTSIEGLRKEINKIIAHKNIK